MTVLASLLVATTMVSGALIVWNLRQDTWHQAQTASLNLASALQREISRTFETYDLSIQGAIEAIQQPGIGQVGQRIRQAALFDHSATTADLGRMMILDTDGTVIASSSPATTDPPAFKDMPFFRRLKENPGLGLQIGSPKPGAPDEAGGKVIRLSRRIDGPGESFAGAVVGSLRLSYFDRLFAPFDIGARGAIAAITMDGAVIARKPPLADDDLRDVLKSRLLDLASIDPVGQYTAASAIDGAERLVTYRKIAGLPIVVTIAVSADELFAPWRMKAIAIVGVLTLICAATLVLLGLFRRELLLRITSERTIADAAARLAVAAATDGLTGLSNRRAFDVQFRHEWHRSSRERQPIALLMLDADHFKAYNDRHGHQAGDDVLQILASCIARNLRRPPDMAARYGGEEFIVLLPNTDILGAAITAEDIRADLVARAIPHPSVATGIATVSIGIASMRPGSAENPADLLRAADQALYAAKADGRNCIRIAGPPGAPGPIPSPPPLRLPALFAH